MDRVKVHFLRTSNAHFSWNELHADPISDIKNQEPERSFITDKNIDYYLFNAVFLLSGRPIFRKLSDRGSVLLGGIGTPRSTGVG